MEMTFSSTRPKESAAASDVTDINRLRTSAGCCAAIGPTNAVALT